MNKLAFSASGAGFTALIGGKDSNTKFTFSILNLESELELTADINKETLSKILENMQLVKGISINEAATNYKVRRRLLK